MAKTILVAAFLGLALLLNNSANAAAPSASGTTVSGSGASIVDAQGNVWTLCSGQAFENGKTQNNCSPSMVTLLLYYNNTVYEENSANVWWSWNGSGWTQISGNPRRGGSSGSSSGSSSSSSSSGGSSSSSSSGTTTAVNGVCGSAENQTLTSAPTSAASLCSAGTPSTTTSNGIAWDWTCAGINGGTTAGCDALVGSSSGGSSVLGNCFNIANAQQTASGVWIGNQNASSTSCFINSIGVITEISNGPAYYDNESVDLADLQYLGITHIRDNYSTNAQSVYTALGQQGIQFDFIMYQGGDLTSANLQSEFTYLNQLNAGCAPASCVFSVEGANEISNAYPVTYNGTTGFQAAVNLQQDIYSMAHADSSLPNLVVYYFTSYGLNGLPVGPDPSTTPGLADYDNAHPYPQNGVPPLEGLANTSCCVNPLRADALINETSLTTPAVYTETGYRNTANTAQQMGAFMLEILLDDASQGIAHTYFFELQEEGSAGDGTASGLGLFNGTNDTVPTPAATAIHNLTTILADTSDEAVIGAYGTLNYSISNPPSLGHSLLLEKSTGTFELAVWSEAESNSTPVVSLGGTYGTVNIYDPLQSATPIQTLSNVSSVPLNLGIDPLVIEVLPNP